MFQAVRGFTLIELMVVLVIIGLAMGLVWPRLETVYDQTRYRRELDEVLLQVGTLGRLARRDMVGLRIGSDGIERDGELLEEPPLELPRGWQLQSDDGITFHESGACGGGRLRVVDPSARVREIELTAPHCRAAR